ncbi:hypothetical protein BHM03_00043392 [Ensete ventricosum]|uniref:Uncharacterized protein n=1 Tax=Ensete ventricosum TaxID=4639 RepID=A0A445MKI2_ENSVE|nr:hypothetical protein BHM03_00043392 [Ensete ventricosum]
MVPQRWVFRVCASKLASDDNLGHLHMRVVYHRGRSQIASISESHGGDLTIQRYDRSGWRVGLLQCSHSFKGAGKSEDKAECKATDSRTMGLAAPWYHRGETSMESLIPCSHGGRALDVKGVEKVKNVEANSKYQDKAIGQRPRNFIRPVSMGFSSR